MKAGGRIHLEGYMITCVLVGIFAVASVCAAAAIAISLRALRLVDWERQVAGFRRFEAAGCTTRLELIAHWCAKGKAYHIGESGRVYCVPAETYYRALITGVHSFWELVAEHAGKSHVVSVDELDFNAGDGEGYLTYVDACGCDAYLDAVFTNVFPCTYPSYRVTVDEFKEKVHKTENKARDGRECHDGVEDRFDVVHGLHG